MIIHCTVPYSGGLACRSRSSYQFPYYFVNLAGKLDNYVFSARCCLPVPSNCQSESRWRYSELLRRWTSHPQKNYRTAIFWYGTF